MEHATKRCKLCGSPGPFGKSAAHLDGLQVLCRPCTNAKQKRRNMTAEGKATTAWQSILKRGNNRSGADPTYAFVDVSITQEEFMTWATSAFGVWMEANPGKVPSVNRIDDNQGYAAGNLEIIEYCENSRLRPQNKNVHAPEGMAWCSGCQQYLDRSCFRATSDRTNSLVCHCRPCERAYHRRYARQYRSKNLEALRSYQREWARKKAVLAEEQVAHA